MNKKLVKSFNYSGASEAQIYIFTGRIQHITEHLKKNKKDLNSQKSLLNLVGKRRKQLTYIKNSNIDIYRNIISKLEIRK